MKLGLFLGRLTVGMRVLQTLIPTVAQTLNRRHHRAVAALEQSYIGHFAFRKGRGNNLAAEFIGDHLRFLGVTLLFAAVIAPLIFFSDAHRDIRWHPEEQSRSGFPVRAGLFCRAGGTACLG